MKRVLLNILILMFACNMAKAQASLKLNTEVKVYKKVVEPNKLGYNKSFARRAENEAGFSFKPTAANFTIDNNMITFVVDGTFASSPGSVNILPKLALPITNFNSYWRRLELPDLNKDFIYTWKRGNEDYYIYYSDLFSFNTTSLVFDVKDGSFSLDPGHKKDLTSSEEERTSLEFVGSAAIQRVITEGTEIPKTTGLGVVFHHKLEASSKGLGIREIYLDAIINVASSVDSITLNSQSSLNEKHALGNFMIIPTTSGRAINVDFRAELNPVLPITRSYLFNITGLHVQVLAAERIFSYNDTSWSASPFVFKAGFYNDFVPKQVRKNFSIMIGMDFAYRTLLGDLSFESETQNRQKFILSDKLNFFYLEPSLVLRFHNVRATAFIPIQIFREGGNNIPGLSGTQFVTTIGFVGGFPVKLTKD